jgi:Fe-S cluster biogenesis protein NfuA
MKLSEILAARERAKEKTVTQVAAPAAARPTKTSAMIKVVRTRETPNPDALQFVLNTQVLDRGSRSFASRKEAERDPLGQALFDVRGVGNVFVMENFVTVTKDETAGWNLLRDLVWKTIEKNVTVYPDSGPAGLEDIDVLNFPSLSREDKLKAVEMVLNRSIRSNLAKDGGGVEVKGVDGNRVLIQYHGACGSCSTSTTGTLKYIQGQLQQQIHKEIEVQSV